VAHLRDGFIVATVGYLIRETLKMVLSNCSTDGVTLCPVYRKAGCDGQILDAVNGGFTQTFGYDGRDAPDFYNPGTPTTMAVSGRSWIL
jgi:hypothetical protein